MSISSFDNDIKRFAKKAGLEVDVAVRKVALHAYKSVTSKTPVDTGRARANWNLSVGNADKSVRGTGFRKSTGSHVDSSTPPSSPKASTPTLQKSDGFKTIWITNSLPYIGLLENGNSKQAPKGMVKITMNEIRSSFK